MVRPYQWTNASELSFVNEQQETDRHEEDVNEHISLRTLAGLSSDGNTSDDDETGDVGSTSSQGAQAKAMASSKRLIVAPHRRRKVVRSQTQALSELSNTMKLMTESQAKRHKKALKRTKKGTFRREAQKNREHEIKLAEIYARIMAQPQTAVHPTHHPHF